MVLVLVLIATVSARMIGLMQLSQHGERSPKTLASWTLPETVPPGQLTTAGLDQQAAHGFALRTNYSHLFSEEYAPQRVYARASDSQSTADSLRSQLKGVYGGDSKRFNVEVVAEEEEALLLPLHNCRRIKHIMKRDQMEMGKHMEIVDRIEEMEDQIRALSPSLDLWSIYNSTEPIINYLQRGIVPPCSPDLVQFLELLHNHINFNLFYGEKQQIKLGVSLLLLEVVNRFKALAEGAEVAPVSLYVGEDVSLVPFLRSLEIQEFPVPGSFLQIELHATDDDFFLHFLFNGNPLSLTRCPHPCSLSSFEKAWQRRMYQTAEKWAEKCEKLNIERPWPWKKISIYSFAFMGIILFMKLKEKIMARFIQMFKKKID